MLSRTTQTPTGRLAMPKTRRVDVLSVPNTLTSNSEAASATFGCSRNSGVVTSDTPRRTTRVTLSSDPKCSLASASAFNAARRLARRPSSTLNSAPIRPKNLGTPSSTGSVPLKKSRFPVWTASTYAPSGAGGRGRSMPRSFSRCSALALVVFVDTTGSPWISLEVASGDRQETPASAVHLRLSPPTQMRAAINVQHLAGDLARLGEIEHGLRDVLGARNPPER